MQGKKIVRLDVENVKRVEAVHIEPDGSMVVIGGKNGAGKTSVIDSIAYALGGKKLLPKKPIREGAKKGSVKVDLGDVIVTRSFTETDSYLKVEAKAGGFVAQSPQDILNGMIGDLSFDPLAFATMDDKARLALLKKLAGLDTDKLDEEKARVFAERTEVNRRVKTLKGQADGIKRIDDVPDAPVNVHDAMEELTASLKNNEENREKELILATARAELVVIEEEKVKACEAIARLNTLLEEETEKAEAKETTIAKMGDAVDELEDVDTAPIREKLSKADSINAAIRSNLALDLIEGELGEKKDEAQAKTDRLNEIDVEKAEKVGAAKFPIPGLGVGEDGVTFGGIPFDQISQAEKLRTSVAMGFAMNPELKVVLIRDGSLLDEDNLKLIAEMAEEADGQVWVERVGDGKEVSVLIVEGNGGNVQEEEAGEEEG